MDEIQKVLIEAGRKYLEKPYDIAENPKHLILKFGNENFNQLNVTVRLNSAYMDMEIGDNFSIEVEGKIVGNAEVRGKCICLLNSFPSDWINMEHERSCRSRRGLYHSIKEYWKKTRGAVDNNFNPLVVGILFSIKG